MMKKFIDFVKNNRKTAILLFVLLLIFFISLTFSCISHAAYNKRLERAVTVSATVQSSEHKERTVTEIGPDDTPTTETETYYLNTATYQFENKTYTHRYQSDNKASVGKNLTLYIDPADPSYVFDNESPALLILIPGLICLTIFLLLIGLYLFKMHVFTITFGLGAFIFSLAFVITKSIVWLLCALPFIGITYIFYRFFKSNPSTK